MAAFDNRVFLASLADIREWGSRSATVLNTLEKTDIIFLLDGGEEPSTAQKNLLQNMKKKAQVKVMELSGEEPLEAGLRILRDYLDKEEAKKKVYLIGSTMEGLREREGELAAACESLTFHKNFQVKQIRKEKEPEEDLQYNLMDMIGLATEGHKMPEGDKGKLPGKPRSGEKKPGKPSGKGPAPARQQMTEASGKDVEQQIFNTRGQKQEYQEFHNQLDDAKALLMLELQNRLHEHIKKELFGMQETVVLSMQQLLGFTVLILRSSNAEEFNLSWSVTERNPEMELKESVFQKIKQEAAYYEKVSVLLYEEDLW
ncbi:hypothetical protein B5E64_05975 [Drancourtella sp. An12]|uniref:hypothetical protein n=1 Tax=Drancourtella sp. An12 TaxID=1965548 RepID=UPI000B38F47A|nr:hypothetical protein [Drancourtella sp. An12]OUQ46305.1 hypothetical protein B5E64_05975 [Drancourtella sp. An12]